MINGRMLELGDELHCDGGEVGQLDLVIDRLVLRDGIEKRLADSLEVASRHGDQVIKIRVLGANETDAAEERVFSQRLVCVNCGPAIPELTPSLFSFNSSQGACATCKDRKSTRLNSSHVKI